MEKKQPVKHELPSAFSLFRPSYEAIMVNIWTFLGLILIPMAGLMLAVSLGATRQDQSTVNVFAAAVAALSMVFLLVVAPALPYAQLRSVHRKQVSMGDALKAGLKYFWRFYGLTLLVGLAVLVGLILFIVPGLIMFRRYYLAQYYLYDQNLGIMDAFRKSAVDSKMFSDAVWGLIGVMVLVQAPGFIPILAVVSAVLSFIYSCAPAIRYLEIKEAAAKATPSPKAAQS